MTDPTQGPRHRIVVGVDGSAGSVTALRWAIEQAGIAGASIEAVIAWEEPVMYSTMSLGYAPVAFDGEDVEKTMTKVLNDSLAEVSAEGGQSVVVIPRVMRGHPTQTLLDAAADADLLVVGSRGHSTFAGLLLGSVSQHCVQHAPCPVVVVPQ
jgi:nucleotide-binding universal stress UspA family protein